MCSSNKEFQERFLRLSMDDGDGVDCEFMLGPQNVVIKGHKCIFSAASEVFKAMFYGDLKEEKVVKVEDLDPEGFKGMKQYIYLGEVNFTSTIHALLTCVSARKYMVPGLGEECIKYVEEKLLPSEVLEFYENCKVLCISEFDHICYNIIQENTDEVVESENFLSSKMETIEQLLKFPYLKLESEGKLFAHFERWALAEADRENISSELIQSRFNNLKKHIRFLTMSLKEFAFYVHHSELLTQEENNSIAQILMNVNSEPMPESLSLEKLHRRFKKPKHFRVIASPLPLCKVNYQYGHIFTILMATPCFSFRNFMMGYSTNYDKISIKVTCIETLGKYLCFYFYCSKDVFYEVGDQEILNIESRLRVLTKEGHGNDLYFVNKSHVIVLDWFVSWGETPKFPFAKIPIVDLKNKYFLKDNSKRVFIEALFNLTIEKR